MPQYEGLSLKQIGVFLDAHHPEVFDYLPDSREIHKVSKEWICNVCATVLGDSFNDWVKQQVEERNAAVTSKRDLMITMDKDVAEIFRSSTKVSRK